MENLSKNVREKLELMDGVECLSLNYEGCVGINGNKVYRSGEIIDTLDTDEKVNNLWDEYIWDEGY